MWKLASDGISCVLANQQEESREKGDDLIQNGHGTVRNVVQSYVEKRERHFTGVVYKYHRRPRILELCHGTCLPPVSQ